MAGFFFGLTALFLLTAPFTLPIALRRGLGADLDDAMFAGLFIGCCMALGSVFPLMALIDLGTT